MTGVCDLPVDGQLVLGDALDRGAVAHQGQHRLAAIAHPAACGQDRLVLDVGIDAEAVARHIGGASAPAPGRDDAGARPPASQG